MLSELSKNIFKAHLFIPNLKWREERADKEGCLLYLIQKEMDLLTGVYYSIECNNKPEIEEEVKLFSYDRKQINNFDFLKRLQKLCQAFYSASLHLPRARRDADAEIVLQLLGDIFFEINLNNSYGEPSTYKQHEYKYKAYNKAYSNFCKLNRPLSRILVKNNHLSEKFKKYVSEESEELSKIANSFRSKEKIWLDNYKEPETENTGENQTV